MAPIRNRALSLVLRLAIAGVFLVAGIEKWRGAHAFMEQIAHRHHPSSRLGWPSCFRRSKWSPPSASYSCVGVRDKPVHSSYWACWWCSRHISHAMIVSPGSISNAARFGKGSPNIASPRVHS